MRRREFIKLLVSAAVAWPYSALAQRTERARRIGLLMNVSEGDPEGQCRVTALEQGLVELGWKAGSNIQIDVRWGAGDRSRYRTCASELIALEPDVLVGSNTSTTRELKKVTSTVPIVFAGSTDPVGGGLVVSLAHPGGNVTGFMGSEFSMSGKWLELLKEIAPWVTRTAVLRDPTTTGSVAQFAAIQAVAPLLKMELTPVDVRTSEEIEGALDGFARGRSDGGLIVVSTALALVHRDVIIAIAARDRLPAVYEQRSYVTSGGLISYGSDRIEPYRRAPSYIDRIFKGDKPADLPVQAPIKYELLINLKTAKALGLEVPPTLLARADEVIE